MKNQKRILSLIGFIILGAFCGKLLVPLFLPTTIHMHALAIARDIPIYTTMADAIVVGAVQNVGQPYFNDDQTLIQSDVDIILTDVIKGDFDSDELKLVQSGGQIGHKRVLVEDSPRFTTGENVLLFLGTNQDDEYVVFAGAYGKYSIDDYGQVTSLGNFKEPYDDLLADIQKTLKTE